jgi:hypothetical protein
MTIKKFRDISEMEDVWYEPGSARLFAVIRYVWALSDRICPLRFPPGVHKHRTIESAEALSEQWEEANFLAHQKRMRGESG